MRTLAGDRSPAETLTARFEPVPQGLPFAIRVVVRGAGLVRIGLPLVARVGEQILVGIVLSPLGDEFMGYLDRVPREGDRLSWGYGEATRQTDIAYRTLVT